MLHIDINKMHDINKIQVNIIMLDVDIIDLACNHTYVNDMTYLAIPIILCVCQHAL